MDTAGKIDYLSQAAAAADQVYAKVVDLACIHKSGSKTYDQMVSNKTVTCAASASIAYQEAGILASGKMVNHLDAAGGTDANILKQKPTIAKAMAGVTNIPADKADIVWIGKKYTELPSKYRKNGVIYIQDSNVCICAEDGAIYSCNHAKDQVNDKGQYIKDKVTSGYPFTSPILVAIIPKVKKEESNLANLNIIDVSRWNPSVNWGKAAKQIDGAVIRAGYRGTGGSLAMDPLFLQHITGAMAAGVKRIGVYWWTTHITIAQAEEDAAYLIKRLKPYKASINFGVWLDSEAAGLTTQSGANGVAFNKLSADNRTTYGKVFLAAMTAAGYKAGVYASDSWFGSRLIMSKLSAYPFWVAKYSATPPRVVNSYAAWQHTSKGSVDGITGTVDQSHFYTDLATGKVTTATNTTKEVHDMDTLKQGDKGQQVKVLQKLLGGMTVDGSFGAKTEAAVETYQTKNGLIVDGIVGPKTWDKLLDG